MVLGGTCITATLTMQHLGDVRPIWTYDTYAGIPEPGREGVSRDGRDAADLYQK